MTRGIDWRGGAPGALAPWRRDTAAVAWVGALATPSLPPNPIEEADAQGLPEPVRPGFLHRRAALRTCVARWTGQSPEAVVIACDAHRRPVVRWPEGGFRVSAASRAGIAAVGLACDPLGIDVEVVAGTQADGVAPAALTPIEAAALAAFPAEARGTAFLALWTAKEAYLKAIGLGLARDPATIGVTVGATGRIALTDAGRGVPVRAAESHMRRIDGIAIRASCVVLR